MSSGTRPPRKRRFKSMSGARTLRCYTERLSSPLSRTSGVEVGKVERAALDIEPDGDQRAAARATATYTIEGSEVELFVDPAASELALRLGRLPRSRATLTAMLVLRFSLLAVLIFGTIGALKLHPRPEAEAATIEISAAERARGLTFDPSVAPADREWILAAVATARPEAARLIAEVDGLVTVRSFRDPNAWALGLAESNGPKRYRVSFNVSRLNGSRRFDRDVVALHELGHVIDSAILPVGLRDRLAALVPQTGACPEGVRADCAPAQERFADTFAKWALRGAVSMTGAGYNLPAPASLEDWGAPLSALAIQLDVSS